MHSPTYIGFTRVLELSPLVKDANGVWRMDYADMDARLGKNHIHLAVPHSLVIEAMERLRKYVFE